MRRVSYRILLVAAALLAFPFASPAPLIYVPGEGWIYESPGKEGKWHRLRAEDQLKVAQNAFETKDYTLALKAARRTVTRWPLSDYAPDAQFLVGQVYEQKKYDEKAFNEYQKLIEKYPKYDKYQQVLERQYEIANRFLGGQWFKLWGRIPIFPSMEKTAAMYEKLVKNGPYSDIGPQAQLNMAAAHEKREDFAKAVKQYEHAADIYHDRKEVSADALFKAGLAYHKQAKTAEYDQNAASQAIATFSDFMALHPEHEKVAEAQKLIAELKTEQARGAFKIAKFYEKQRRWAGAMVYYNEVLLKDPNSEFAPEARERIEILKARLGHGVEGGN
jgi:outer membrane protein assembly factor BamD